MSHHSRCEESIRATKLGGKLHTQGQATLEYALVLFFVLNCHYCVSWCISLCAKQLFNWLLKLLHILCMTLLDLA